MNREARAGVREGRVGHWTGGWRWRKETDKHRMEAVHHMEGRRLLFLLTKIIRRGQMIVAELFRIAEHRQPIFLNEGEAESLHEKQEWFSFSDCFI